MILRINFQKVEVVSKLFSGALLPFGGLLLTKELFADLALFVQTTIFLTSLMMFGQNRYFYRGCDNEIIDRFSASLIWATAWALLIVVVCLLGLTYLESVNPFFALVAAILAIIRLVHFYWRYTEAIKPYIYGKFLTVIIRSSLGLFLVIQYQSIIPFILLEILINVPLLVSFLLQEREVFPGNLSGLKRHFGALRVGIFTSAEVVLAGFATYFDKLYVIGVFPLVIYSEYSLLSSVGAFFVFASVYVSTKWEPRLYKSGNDDTIYRLYQRDSLRWMIAALIVSGACSLVLASFSKLTEIGSMSVLLILVGAGLFSLAPPFVARLSAKGRVEGVLYAYGTSSLFFFSLILLAEESLSFEFFSLVYLSSAGFLLASLSVASRLLPGKN